MISFSNYRLVRKTGRELTTGQTLYGENEPPEMQLENLWKIVDRDTGEELAEPRPDYSEFSTGDRMYPSMMKPEVKRRWDMKKYEWEEAKAAHSKLKRMVHARFMEDNPELPVVQSLKRTTYGNEILNEYRKQAQRPSRPERTPRTGTGRAISDELERDNVDLNEIADEVLQFQTPEAENTYAILAVNRDQNLRIEAKLLVSSENSHAMDYEYDAEGRLQAVRYSGQPVEIYRYNRSGQRVFSQVAGADQLEYKFNNLGQLMRAGETTYKYDSNGDLTQKNSPEGITTYGYLKTGQLCEVSLPDGTTVEYRFDKRGFRTAKYVNGQLVQRYQWKDLTTLAAFEDADGVSRFIYDEHNRALGMERNGQVSLFATDQLGSIFTIADPTGKSVQEILYDSFGRRIHDSSPDFDLPLGFAGGLCDSDTGLIHFGHREYDPVVGRFISPDPLGYGGGDVDLYGYCFDDPINFVERDGLRGRSEKAEDGEQSQDGEQESTKDEETKKSQKNKDNQKSKSSEDSFDDDHQNKKYSHGYVAGAGFSYAIPGIEGSVGVDAAYINEDDAAVYFTSGVKGSSGLGFSADFSAGTHNATKAEDLEGSSTTASAGVAIPGTPISVGYSKEMSKSSTVDKANFSIGAKVNPVLLPEVSGGRSNSKKLFTFNPPFNEMGEAARRATKPIDKNLEKQIQSRKTKPIIPPRTSVRKK